MNAQERRLHDVVAQDRERDGRDELLAQERGRLAVQRELRSRQRPRNFGWDQLPRTRRSPGLSLAAEARALGLSFLIAIAAALLAGAALEGTFHLLSRALQHLG